MKIRIRGNSIRYRLTKSEVEAFCTTGYFEDNIDFSNKKLTYALQTKTGIDTLDADFKNDTITMYLEKEKKVGWFESNQVGFSDTTKQENGTALALLLEKDFVCMDETVEDQSDNYPNPKN